MHTIDVIVILIAYRFTFVTYVVVHSLSLLTEIDIYISIGYGTGFLRGFFVYCFMRTRNCFDF